ncbi:Phosphate import ATP-binding protein pstB [Agrobacterium tumefaciens]|nr:Phosphate import ATP-binding protein pstB [Agrobacterium tumefaciens]
MMIATAPAGQAEPPAGQAEPRVVLSARGLTKTFGAFAAVKNVDLDVHHARVHALIGPNGAGKTTVFNLLTKFLQPTGGAITFMGTDITKTPPDKVARLGLVRSFQISAVFPHLTVLENVRVALQRPNSLATQFWLPLSSLDRLNARAEELISMVGLTREKMRLRPICLTVASGFSKSPPRWRSIQRFCCWTSPWLAWVGKMSPMSPNSSARWPKPARC